MPAEGAQGCPTSTDLEEGGKAGNKAAPRSPETPAPEAPTAKEVKEHVLVRVLSDGTLVPISTGGLKKVRLKSRLCTPLGAGVGPPRPGAS